MLLFVVAMESEARPLAEGFRLARDPEVGAFQVFRGDGAALVVSGLGKVAAAAATAYLHVYTGGARHAAWINAGIAGHGSLAVGEAVLAHKVRDRASGRCWYPPHVFTPRGPTCEVVTVDRVERGYAGDVAYEMEASGFYPTACRFSTSELVQCVKVVSDGPERSPERLSAKRVEALMGDRLDRIEWLAGEISRLAREASRLEVDPPEFCAILARWHFTVTEKHQLRRLLQRWRALAPGSPLPEADLARARRGKDVVRRLRTWLDGLPVELDSGSARERSDES